MLNVTDLKPGATFQQDGLKFIVVKYEHIKMGRGSGNIKVKVRNLETGSTIEKSFITGARVEPLEIQYREANFLYQAGQSLVFMDQQTFEQFEIETQLLGDQKKFLQEGQKIKILFTLGVKKKPVAVELPPKMTFTVAEADPGVKGNSAANMLKSVKLDNGLIIRAPLFIKVGDKIAVDTRTGEYVSRTKD